VAEEPGNVGPIPVGLVLAPGAVPAQAALGVSVVDMPSRIRIEYRGCP
jgi:hypothetical protein